MLSDDQRRANRNQLLRKLQELAPHQSSDLLARYAATLEQKAFVSHGTSMEAYNDYINKGFHMIRNNLQAQAGRATGQMPTVPAQSFQQGPPSQVSSGPHGLMTGPQGGMPAPGVMQQGLQVPGALNMMQGPGQGAMGAGAMMMPSQGHHGLQPGLPGPSGGPMTTPSVQAMPGLPAAQMGVQAPQVPNVPSAHDSQSLLQPHQAKFGSQPQMGGLAPAGEEDEYAAFLSTFAGDDPGPGDAGTLGAAGTGAPDMGAPMMQPGGMSIQTVGSLGTSGGQQMQPMPQGVYNGMQMQQVPAGAPQMQQHPGPGPQMGVGPLMGGPDPNAAALQQQQQQQQRQAMQQRQQQVMQQQQQMLDANALASAAAGSTGLQVQPHGSQGAAAAQSAPADLHTPLPAEYVDRFWAKLAHMAARYTAFLQGYAAQVEVQLQRNPHGDRRTLNFLRECIRLLQYDRATHGAPTHGDFKLLGKAEQTVKVYMERRKNKQMQMQQQLQQQQQQQQGVGQVLASRAPSPGTAPPPGWNAPLQQGSLPMSMQQQQQASGTGQTAAKAETPGTDQVGPAAAAISAATKQEVLVKQEVHALHTPSPKADISIAKGELKAPLDRTPANLASPHAPVAEQISMLLRQQASQHGATQQGPTPQSSSSSQRRSASTPYSAHLQLPPYPQAPLQKFGNGWTGQQVQSMVHSKQDAAMCYQPNGGSDMMMLSQPPGTCFDVFWDGPGTALHRVQSSQQVGSRGGGMAGGPVHPPPQAAGAMGNKRLCEELQQQLDRAPKLMRTGTKLLGHFSANNVGSIEVTPHRSPGQPSPSYYPSIQMHLVDTPDLPAPLVASMRQSPSLRSNTTGPPAMGNPAYWQAGLSDPGWAPLSVQAQQADLAMNAFSANMRSSSTQPRQPVPLHEAADAWSNSVVSFYSPSDRS